MATKQQQLTKAETQVMNVLWSLPDEKGFSSDIMKRMPKPKPAMTTLLTFLKILKDKGFVATEKMGKSNLFSALVSKDEYTESFLRYVKKTFFDDSFTSLVSFFTKRENLSEEQIREIVQIIENDGRLKMEDRK
ncbi:MAG: BlaI/MecI/CopY family transcriptional regulator [Prevotella sp.]|nr:BlaI/MecI/CopY family transcriptional regulator [Prevotella sp.]